jgi:hypothetical protein
MSLNNEISESSIAACCRGQAFWLLNGRHLSLNKGKADTQIVDIMQQLDIIRVIAFNIVTRLFESSKCGV